MKNTTTNHLMLELHVPDFDAVLEFYGKLGFKKVWHSNAENNPEYLVMNREGVVINFWPGNESVYERSHFKKHSGNSPRGYGIEIVIPVENVAKLYDDLKNDVNIQSPLKKRPWGLLDFRVEDPFGYYLRITEPHDVTSPDYAVNKGKG